MCSKKRPEIGGGEAEADSPAAVVLASSLSVFKKEWEPDRWLPSDPLARCSQMALRCKGARETEYFVFVACVMGERGEERGQR